MNHPTVSYCQGMSDLASPLLVTMGDEAHAYICLCALMARLFPNFLLDGEAMTLKFTHLTESLQVYDPDFYNYLKSQQADDLLFCYRWLLLEMKREFAFDDALRMLEVLWASLPQKTPTVELSLKEKEFDPTLEMNIEPPPLSPLMKAPRENAYTKVCAIRRQSSTFSLANPKASTFANYKQMNHSLDENATRKNVTNASLKHAKEFQSLDDAALQVQRLKLEKQARISDRSKDINLISKDAKSPTRLLMKSVPEDSKNVDLRDAKGSLTNGNAHCDSKETPLGSQIRLLRNKISMHNNKFFSLDKLDASVEMDSENKPKVKMIKNLNEFLNLATGSKPGPCRQEKLQRTHSAVEDTRSKGCPRIMLTKTSFDESDLGTQHGNVDHKVLNKPNNKNIYTDCNDGSSPDDSQEYYPMTTSMTRELRLELEHLDRQVFGPSYVNRCSMVCDSPSESLSTEEKLLTTDTKPESDAARSNLDVETEVSEAVETIKKSPLLETVRSNAKSAEDIYLWENPLHRNTPTTRTTASCPQTPDEQADLDYDRDTGEIIEEHSGKKSITPIRLLRKNQSFDPKDLKQDTKHSNAHSAESSDSSDRDITEPNTAAETDVPVTGSSKSHKFFSSMSQELENAKKNCETLLNAKQTNLHSVTSTINSFQKKYEALKPPVQRNVNVATAGGGDASGKSSISSLPPPGVFGGGNPFLMFLCLTVLLQHRDYVMRNRMDYNELAMHFDKMVRKHNVNRVLNQARQMYAIYLKQQAHKTGNVTT